MWVCGIPDLALGRSDSALMDFTDVILARATLEQAAVRHPRCDRLYLLTAPVGLHEDIRTSEMKRLLDEVRSRFDYCLIDSGAGLGDAFRLATCAADRAVVVATTDPTSLRDAQRTVMELREYPNGKLHLVVNRVRRKLLKALSSNIDDAIDAAGLPLLGVIPEDEGIPIALGRSAPDRILPREQRRDRLPQHRAPSHRRARAADEAAAAIKQKIINLR